MTALNPQTPAPGATTPLVALGAGHSSAEDAPMPTPVADPAPDFAPDGVDLTSPSLDLSDEARAHTLRLARGALLFARDHVCYAVRELRLADVDTFHDDAEALRIELVSLIERLDMRGVQ